MACVEWVPALAFCEAGRVPVSTRVTSYHARPSSTLANLAHRWRIFCSRLRRRMRFLRHFQRIFPRFFQARDERFIGCRAPRIRVPVK